MEISVVVVFVNLSVLEDGVKFFIIDGEFDE